MEIFALSGLINAIFAVTFGIIVILKNWRDRINQLFFLMTVSLTLWGIGYWQWLLADSNDSALFWVRILSIGSIFIPAFYFHWVLFLLDFNKEKWFLIKLIYFVSLLLLFFSFSDLFIKGVTQRMNFPFWPVPGILYHFYLFAIYSLIAFYSLFLLFKKYNISPPEKSGQIFYVIVGAVLGFGGGMTNFFLWYDLPIKPYGNFLVALFPFFFGYATLKFHLFNIGVIATELLTYAIWVFILTRTILAESFREILTNGILLFFMIIFGILLIRSVRQEVRQREKLEILTKELEDKNVKLQELDKVRSEFLSFASHQVKAPMTVVKGFASMIYDGTLGQASEKIKEAAQKIQISAERLIALVNNLLDLRRIEEGKMEFNFEKVEINDLVSGLVEEFKMLAKNKGLELIYKPPSEKIFINADPQKFRQVIQNLIDNSIKYTEKGWVKVEIEKEDKKNVLMSISDSGRGIPKELFPNLFKQFSRDHELAKELQGTGLGLYIAKQIIDAHQGQIWAESPGQNQGSIFYVRMPVGSFNKIEI